LLNPEKEETKPSAPSTAEKVSIKDKFMQKRNNETVNQPTEEQKLQAIMKAEA
jgi:hypothetical protein